MCSSHGGKSRPVLLVLSCSSETWCHFAGCIDTVALCNSLRSWLCPATSFPLSSVNIHWVLRIFHCLPCSCRPSCADARIAFNEPNLPPRCTEMLSLSHAMVLLDGAGALSCSGGHTAASRRRAALAALSERPPEDMLAVVRWGLHRRGYRRPRFAHMSLLKPVCFAHGGGGWRHSLFFEWEMLDERRLCTNILCCELVAGGCKQQ